MERASQGLDPGRYEVPIVKRKEEMSGFCMEMFTWEVQAEACTVAFEALILGEAASEKIGYKPHRAYQIQSGLANAATAVTALLVYVLDWGRYADHNCYGNVDVLCFLGGKSCRHRRHGTEHENGQFNASGPGVVIDWLPASPDDQSADSVSIR